MQPERTASELTGMLETVKTAMHERFPDHHARLEQLDSHLATVVMVIEQIHDEDVRHRA